MPSTLLDRVKRADQPLVLNGPAGRRLPLRILFVHSDAAEVESCVEELRRAHFKVRLDVVLTPEQFAGRLNSKYYDVVLAEYPAPNWQGPQALEILRPRDRQIPCIFLTDTMQPETVAELITEGAADCVGMDHVGHLPVAIRRALNENNLREERDQTEKKLRHSEARYRALVGNLNYGMCRCNTKGNFLDVNQALVTMLGYPSRAELLGVNLAAGILCDPSKRAHLLGHSVELDSADPLEIEWKRKNGTTLRVRLSGRKVANEGETDSYEIIVEDVTRQRKLEDHLRQQAATDPLTGLANYRHLVETVDLEINRTERTAREFALLFLDLDGLKKINDRCGHLVGSQALCRLADVLCICSRKIDTPARFGGDEFALVLPETGQVEANLVARRICDSLANDGGEPKLSVSVGVAIYPKDGEKVDSLLGAADAALYAMKARKRSPDASAPTGRPLSCAIKRRPVARRIGEPMKQEPKLISVNGTSAFRLDPSLTSEEAIVLRALAARRTNRQVCNELRMDPTTFLRMMRDMREKIGAADRGSLIEWTKRQIKGIDQRIDKPERYARPA